MIREYDHFEDNFNPSFKVFHELMARKVRKILLVSSFYDAWIMEEDCRLSERIIHEYQGLNLSQPPRLTWVSSAEKALAALEESDFDLVVTMPRLADMNAFSLGRRIKGKMPDLPVVLLTHSALAPRINSGQSTRPEIDGVYVWSGNTEILLALIKGVEDRFNVVRDTTVAGVRVILFVEDSPIYASALLPILYREVVSQVQAVLGEGLNEEHRLLTMRARPKILRAADFEEAVRLFKQFEPYVLGVISDVSFFRNGRMDNVAGIDFLNWVKRDRFDIPLLLTSSEPANREKAAGIPATFIDKNSSSLTAEVREFFVEQLGFGDFVFRSPDGREIARATNSRALEDILHEIPDASFCFHWNRNDFSRWLFARSDPIVAAGIRPVTADDFSNDVPQMRKFLGATLKSRRRRRQKGVVVNFDPADFDPETDFLKIGKGSLGGKARGLAFIWSLLQRQPEIYEKFSGVNILVPRTLVLTTDSFDLFVKSNGLKPLAKADLPDSEILDRFQGADFPVDRTTDLAAYLDKIDHPLAVRSSGLLEDAQFKAYAGLYYTHMVPNDHPDRQVRLGHLLWAIKAVYASTYFQGPKAFARRVGHRTEDEKMAVIIQEVVGSACGDYFYPPISGVAQSHNYYPFGRMRPEEGIASIALGLGRTVMEGEQILRFSPRYPQLQAQRASVDDILKNAQRYFYAIKLGVDISGGEIEESDYLVRRDVSDAAGETPVKRLSSTYVPGEHRIRHTTEVPGHRVLTFAPVLQFGQFPLAPLLVDALALLHEGMGCAVELEFSVDLSGDDDRKPEFAFLQTRPMTARTDLMTVDILETDVARAFCCSTQALGNIDNREIADIVYVKPDAFDPGRTPEMALEISRFNGHLIQEGRKYLLIGPGRWGSADRFLGIPVTWQHISAVGAVVEAVSPMLNTEPSQGSHFFHNITTLGISYLTVSDREGNFIDWQWLTSLPPLKETDHVAHLRLAQPIRLKVDGRCSRGVALV